MPRFAVVISMVIIGMLSLGASFGTQPPPNETDTLSVGREVAIAEVNGQIFRVLLEPIQSGASLKPGELLLVRKGASFAVGGVRIGPESHGDRFVRVQ